MFSDKTFLAVVTASLFLDAVPSVAVEPLFVTVTVVDFSCCAFSLATNLLLAWMACCASLNAVLFSTCFAVVSSSALTCLSWSCLISDLDCSSFVGVVSVPLSTDLVSETFTPASFAFPAALVTTPLSIATDWLPVDLPACIAYALLSFLLSGWTASSANTDPAEKATIPATAIPDTNPLAHFFLRKYPCPFVFSVIYVSFF